MSRFAVNSPVKITMIFVGILLLGWISLSRLPTNLFPDISAPRITVTVRATGLSPMEVERRLSEVLERSLYSVQGVTSVQSISRADSAVVVVNFTWETRLEFAFLEVKKAASDLQRTRSSEVESVSVLRYDPNATPIVTVALTAPESTDPESVYRTAEQTLKPRFERLEGVANIVLTGGMQREVMISLDEALLLGYNIQVSDVVNALRSDNMDATGGWVEEGSRRYLLKAVGKYQNVQEISRVVVGRRGDSTILLQDVAKVSLEPREATSIVSFKGQPAVGMAFYREAESNTVAVAQEVRKELELSKVLLAPGWKMEVANDQSLFIGQAIREVRNNALLGGLLAVVVLLFFLRDFRTTMIVAIAIPISIVATFNLMYFQGLSLNLMSLGGLALGSGMLVDNAIVVLENIFRLRQNGVDAKTAASEGATEVAGALVASTLTTVAVFLPIAYLQGLVALLFREQALTVSYSLLASLLVALLLIPMLAAWFLGKPAAAFRLRESMVVPRNVYTRSLALALRFRLLVLLLAVGSLLVTARYAVNIAQEFLPGTNVSQVAVRLVLPNGTPIGATDRLVQSIVSQFERYDAAISSVYTRVGEPEGVVNANTEDPDGPNTADLLITLHDRDKPTTQMLTLGMKGFGSNELIAGMKPTLDRIEDAKVEFRASQGSIMELLGSSGAPLMVEISGPELDVLTRLAADAQQRLQQVPGLVNVRTNLLDGAPEVLVRLDKTQLARYGMDVRSVGAILKQRIDGEVATQIRHEAGDVDLRVQVDYGRESLETLENITFRTSTGAMVRLASIAEFDMERGPREIIRKRQERVAQVMADLADGSRLSDGITAAQAALASLPLPPRYLLSYTGEEEQRRESFGDLAFALILSIVLVYMVMASIFESFLQPFLIMITIPLAGVGVVIGLIGTGQTLNVMSIIGIVMLGGIVVNNAIVLLDCVNQVRSQATKDGESVTLRDTLLIGCARRLRPVIMTTATTLLGLLPMAIGLGEGAELRQAMAVTVLGGLLSSTVLTLYVIPCCQSYLDSAVVAVARLRQRFSKRIS